MVAGAQRELVTGRNEMMPKEKVRGALLELLCNTEKAIGFEKAMGKLETWITGDTQRIVRGDGEVPAMLGVLCCANDDYNEEVRLHAEATQAGTFLTLYIGTGSDPLHNEPAQEQRT